MKIGDRVKTTPYHFSNEGYNVAGVIIDMVTQPINKYSKATYTLVTLKTDADDISTVDAIWLMPVE